MEAKQALLVQIEDLNPGLDLNQDNVDSRAACRIKRIGRPVLVDQTDFSPLVARTG
ncbi:hypothetical protein [Bradyrhizobium sp. CCBAU 53338]|uniref:hypothetical protein n=1 Tax=Bradyrhizobium sp. CCBAU 53338 TaxID=1325111 RepID=UPI00188A9E7E|nr:hypothetical protein [Bradyrhizobium sp. CCBAU 53338]